MARPNPCAPPVTTAQWPFRSILFMAKVLILYRVSNRASPAFVVIPGCAAWRRPQMRNCASGNLYSRWCLWIPGSRFARPGMTLKRVAAVDDMGNAGGECALIAREIDRQQSDFLGGAEPSHRLATHEHLAAAGACGGGAVEH